MIAALCSCIIPPALLPPTPNLVWTRAGHDALMIHVSPLRPSSRMFPQVMFGLAVGMMTEYATGVDFPNQLRLLCSYLGVLDLE